MTTLQLPDFGAIPATAPKPLSTDAYLRFIAFCLSSLPKVRREKIEPSSYVRFSLE
jgi:hypothetical protein